MIVERTKTTRRGNHRSNGKFVLKLALDEQDRQDAWELCRDIERMGGVDTEDGYAFASATRRTMAQDLLSEKYGAWYFRAVNGHERNKSHRLLIADSCKDLAKDYRAVFSRHGYHVDMAHDGPNCMELLHVFSPNALIVERELPWGGGDGVLARIRENPRFRNVAVVLTVESAPAGGLSSLVRPPVVACVQKPFRFSPLLKAINDAVAGAAHHD